MVIVKSSLILHTSVPWISSPANQLYCSLPGGRARASENMAVSHDYHMCVCEPSSWINLYTGIEQWVGGVQSYAPSK